MIFFHTDFNDFFFLFLIRTSVKTTFVFWLKQIPVPYLFVAPTVSNPSVEPTQQSEKRPKLTRKTTRIQQHNLRPVQQQLTDRKTRLRSKPKQQQQQCSHKSSTMEFYDWNTNFQAPVFVLLTLATTPQRFSQVNKHIFFMEFFLAVENRFLNDHTIALT